MKVTRTQEEKLELIDALNEMWRADDSTTDYIHQDIAAIIQGDYLVEDIIEAKRLAMTDVAAWLVGKKVSIKQHSPAMKDDIDVGAEIVNHYEDRLIVVVTDYPEEMPVQEVHEIERVPVSMEALSSDIGEIFSEYKNTTGKDPEDIKPTRRFEIELIEKKRQRETKEMKKGK